MFPSIGAKGNSGLSTTDKMEPGEGGVLVEVPRGGRDCGGSCD